MDLSTRTTQIMDIRKKKYQNSKKKLEKEKKEEEVRGIYANSLYEKIITRYKSRKGIIYKAYKVFKRSLNSSTEDDLGEVFSNSFEYQKVLSNETNHPNINFFT